MKITIDTDEIAKRMVRNDFDVNAMLVEDVYDEWTNIFADSIEQLYHVESQVKTSLEKLFGQKNKSESILGV